VLLQSEGGAGHAHKEVTSPAQKMKGLEQGLAQVSTERDALRADADREAATA
jgi:hypothetical protein